MSSNFAFFDYFDKCLMQFGPMNVCYYFTLKTPSLLDQQHLMFQVLGGRLGQGGVRRPVLFRPSQGRCADIRSQQLPD